MKINKVIAAVLSASLFLASIGPVSLAKFSDVENSKAIDVVTGIGIMHGSIDGTFSPEENLTRAEFAQIVSDIYTYGTEIDAVAEWKENFFEGVFEAETEFIPPEEMNQIVSELYSDVQEGNEYYKAIEFVTDRNIMRGTGNGEFNPDGNVTIEQALKVILTMMGYGVRAEGLGGYPHGYVSVASEINMLGNVNPYYSGYATKEDVANILYNALDIPLMQYSTAHGTWSYTSFEDETFLTKILDLGYDRGRMTANGYTTLTGKDSAGKNTVTINGVVYDVNEETDYARAFIGRDVEVYYSLNDDSEGFVYACLSERDTVTKFDIADYVDYTRGQLTYNIGTKERKLSLVSMPYMIKNGSAVSSFDSSIFDFNYGTVEVIEPIKKSEADLIILKSYQNFNVEVVDRKKEAIYSSASLVGSEIDLSGENRAVIVYDDAGNETTTEALAAGTITSVCYGDKKIEIYISADVKQKFTVKRIEPTDNGEYRLSDGKESYILSKDFVDMNPGVLPKLNATYDFKLDIFGNIVHMREVAGGVSIAFLNNVERGVDDSTFADVVRLNYYDLEQKTMNSSYLADKVKILYQDTNGKDKEKIYSLDKQLMEIYTLLYESICQSIEGVETVTGSMIRCTANDEGNLDWIELPGKMENSLDDSSRLVEIPENTGDSNKLYGAAGLYGGNIIIPKTAKVLQCNYLSDKFEEIEGYNIADRNLFSEGKTYELKAYTTVKNSPVAEYVVYYSDPSVSITTKAPQTCGIVMDDVYEIWDDADEEVKSVLVLSTGEFAVDGGALNSGNVKNVQGDSGYVDGNGRTHSFAVEKGDIIRYGLNAEGKINSVQLLYDANADYGAGLTVKGTVYDGWSRMGNLAGIIDGFTTDADMHKYTNPYSAKNLGTSETTFVTNPYTWTVYDDNMRVMAGSIVRSGSNYVVTTTRNLVENPGRVEVGGDGKYATNVWDISNCTLVTIGRKAVSVETVGNMDLKTYEATGAACDRVVITSRLGRPYNFIVYRYEQ